MSMMTRCKPFSGVRGAVQGETLGRPVPMREADGGAGLVVVCVCGQTVLVSPDDPMPALWCDTCSGGVK